MRMFKCREVNLAQVCFVARKHGFIEFEGNHLDLPEDQFVTIFLAKPIQEIRKILCSIELIESHSQVNEIETKNEMYDKYDDVYDYDCDTSKSCRKDRKNDDSNRQFMEPVSETILVDNGKYSRNMFTI